MRYFAIIICFCCVLACTKTRTVKLPPYEPRLVLHGYVEVGDTFRIAVGKTMPQDRIAKPEETNIANGWIALYENDVFVDSLKYNAGRKLYVSSKVVAASGKIYRVRAGAVGFPDVEAFTDAPLPVNLTSVTRIKNARRTVGGSMLDDVKLSFNDPAGANFYLADITIVNGVYCAFTYDPAVEKYATDFGAFGSGNCIDSKTLLYTDRSFNGTAKELILSLYSTALDSFVDISGAVHRAYVKQYNITEDYYRYVKTSVYQEQIFEEGSLTAEPRTPKGNVKNGFGLFTVFAGVTDTIR